MFVKKKKNRFGTTIVVVAEKKRGVYDELVTIGIAREPSDIDSLVNAGQEWISKEKAIRISTCSARRARPVTGRGRRCSVCCRRSRAS